MKTYWYQNTIVYHLFPLGAAGAPQYNQANDPIVYRLDQLYPWIDHALSLGATTLFLGPVFESSTHGYDIRDYYHIDRRLGDIGSFEKFANTVHQKGLQLVLDAVFNHVGREFWAFRDVLEKGESSTYVDWFENLRFGETSPKGDPFSYQAWQGHYDLVKLNLAHPEVRAHLFEAVRMWMERFQVDGLRLDAADCIDFDFLRALRSFAKAYREDFWLMGEVVHGSYQDWVNPNTLDSVTNYSGYKGLYSSLRDKNYFEIAHTLEYQFGSNGRYKDMCLYNFVDNHDVDRVASKLPDTRDIFPLYLLLYTIPGIPSIYYGSEWGLEGVKGEHTDAPLRPMLNLNAMQEQPRQPELSKVITKLGEIRRKSSALCFGDFKLLFIDHQQLAFSRQTSDEKIVVILNSSAEVVSLNLHLPNQGGEFIDILNNRESFSVHGGHLRVSISPSWGRILKST